MGIYNLDKIFRPRSVAVIGASDEPESLGSALMKNLIEGGFDGSVLPINPGHLKIRGHAAYRILLDLTVPENTGTGLYRKLHNKKEYRDIPVIVISGLAGSYLAVSRSVPVIEKPPVTRSSSCGRFAKALEAPL